MNSAAIEIQHEGRPERFIYSIRGKQVILDSDLARLYEVATKNLNRAANRHSDRFPEDFRFQLTKEEYEDLRCQIVTSKDASERRGGRRYIPYAYTEQGVAMLSGLLNSPKAVCVSVEIMRAFVEMRRFIANNAALLDRMATIEYRQLEYQQSTDERFDRVFGYLDAYSLPAQKIFFKGEMFDAFSLLVDLVASAKKSITLVDGYIDEKTLNILAKKKEDVDCRLITYPSWSLTSEDIKVFESQYGSLQIIRSIAFHDRFLILDKAVIYHIGASLKDAGKRTFALSLIEDDEVKQALINKLEQAL